MILSVREAWRRLRTAKPPEVRPDVSHEVLQSLRWMHQEHVKDLCRLGYSPKEAFWLDFACLPFLPWDGTNGSEMPLSWVLRLYADLYRSTIDSLGADEEPAFVELLRQRYHHMRQVVTAAAPTLSDDAKDRTPERMDTEPAKWALGGLIVLRTAREWQAHQAGFPCRLMEDL
jgi:hypothetical protein